MGTKQTEKPEKPNPITVIIAEDGSCIFRQQPHPFIMNGWGLQERACPFSVSPVDQPQPR